MPKLARAKREAIVRNGLAPIRSSLLLALLLASAASSAQAIGCEDVEFSASTIDEFPSVARSCHSVVERDGRLYVRLVADVVEVRADGSIALELKAPDGTRTPQDFRPPPGFRAMLSGKPASPRTLRRGQEIRLYLPADRWRVAGESSARPTD